MERGNQVQMGTSWQAAFAKQKTNKKKSNQIEAGKTGDLGKSGWTATSIHLFILLRRVVVELEPVLAGYPMSKSAVHHMADM